MRDSGFKAGSPAGPIRGYLRNMYCMSDFDHDVRHILVDAQRFRMVLRQSVRSRLH
jgi:hypothetical protein